ncbi:putative helicase [Lipingzhangella halophila]|uniref:Putative helicase n=1 Tax=Lipingzhangella halophila TaxID=1783352 RepID=A0A7W7RIV9_9ACTN|nr:DEAD/DEAH box helicase family protein [Lipingzhangella halophila]MBB4932809.1 putative helicase [Lipingzhangella halophila]
MPYLRPHQIEAVEASLKAFSNEESRVHDVLACGTGKTRIGRAVVDALLRNEGRVLVAAPRINLLVQALAEYRVAGDAGLGRVVIVCSDSAITSDGRLGGIDLTVTTSAACVEALARGPGRVTVFSTYGSLPTLIETHQRGLGPWDLVVADEAHYLVGQGKWARIHDDACVPARRRKYTTATPRILTPRATSGDTVLTGDMADAATFGRRAFELTFAEAIERGLLAPFRVITPVVTRGQVRQLVDQATHLEVGRGALSADVAAMQLASLKAMIEFDAQRALTFRPRVSHARLWATSLAHIPELIPEWQGTVWARHLNGTHTGRTRARVLEQFSAPAEPATKRFLTNVALFRDGLTRPAATRWCSPTPSPQSRWRCRCSAAHCALILSARTRPRRSSCRCFWANRTTESTRWTRPHGRWSGPHCAPWPR